MIQDVLGSHCLRQITPEQSLWVLDEWLLSSDRNRLSAMQRAICGCCLLEAFLCAPEAKRDVLSITVGIENIYPALQSMPSRAIATVRRLFDDINSADKMDCDEWEAAHIRLTLAMLNDLCGRVAKVDMKQVARDLRLLLTDATAAEPELRSVRLAVDALVACPGLSSTAKEAVRAGGTVE